MIILETSVASIIYKLRVDRGECRVDKVSPRSDLNLQEPFLAACSPPT